ncbi:MAG: type VI secretion system Vgr family protein [Planctomycetota bacterium]|jgi:type VI secretion system secreted protein VgrG
MRTQAERGAIVKSPLGGDVLLLAAMSGSEQLGTPFELHLDLTSEEHEIAIDDVLGQSMTISIDAAGGQRHFNGIVSRFAQVGFVKDTSERYLARYQATLVPWLWLLTRTADCRIFQEKTVLDIIKEVFRDNGFTDFDDRTTGSYPQRDFCVQYRETDFNFVSRLMEEVGIYYYFLHEDGKHTLVLADDYGSHGALPEYDEIPYFPPGNPEARERDHVSMWSLARQVQSGQYALDEFDFEKPKADMTAKTAVSRAHAEGNHEVFDYPGQYATTSEGDNCARVRIEALQAQHELVRGGGTVRGVVAGALFNLTDFPRGDQNREYLVVGVAHDLQVSGGESGGGGPSALYQCTFSAIDSRQPYRTPRTTPRPVVQGPQTAIVVGKSGEEIWTDKHGRVKLQFHWDRYGKSDENSSCWVRVSQAWAGSTWGHIQIPRIGQEVIVEFLEGDPDRPIVTGRVYNGDNKTPYELPANQTQSGLKTRSTKDGDAKTFNELRFEDKKGEEHVYFHAEKDFERVVENNDSLKVGFEDKDKGDQTIEVYNDRTTKIGNNDTLEVGLSIRKKGDQTIKIQNHQTVTLEQGNQTTTIKAGDQTTKVSAGKTLHEACQSITLKVGSSSIKIEPAKITIKAPQIAIQADTKLDAKAGAMANVEGSAMLNLKGGVVKIN